MSFNVKYIFPGDDKTQILSKVNYNFAQVLFNAIGEKGPIGEIGPTGIIGEVGIDGEIGATGQRASNWFFSITEPQITESQKYDIWVNIGATGAQEVYVFSGTNWVFSGETLLADSIFGLLTGIVGPGASTTHNAINFSDPTPSNETFVVSDAVSSTGNINPNLAKFLVATDASTVALPVFGFDKTFVGSASIPSFSWDETGGSYHTVLSSPDNLVFSSGLTAEFSATGGTATISSSGQLTIQSNSAISFENATISGASASYSTPNIITFSSSNKQLTTSQLSYLNLALGAGITAASSELVQVSTPGNGMLVETVGSTGATGSAIVTFVNSSGYKILESRSNNLNVVGQSGPSGSASGRFVKAVQALTNVSASSTFLRGSSLNNYVPVSLTSSSSDLIYIVPKYVNAASISADGKQYRVYLQLTGFTNTWDTLLQEGRTFDIFLEDDILCFGGIRTVYPGGASTAQIGDISNGATGGCRHIRVTTISSGNIFYYAFTPKLTSPSRCGYIAITSEAASTPVGPISGA
jgi:hypothetical protein